MLLARHTLCLPILLPMLVWQAASGGQTIEHRAASTLTAVELDRGDTLRFTLADGSTRTLCVDDTWAETLLTNLKAPKQGFGGGGSLYRFACRVRIDGHPMTMVRYVPVQESFYEPYVVNGLRIWLDAVREIGNLFNETHGECLPHKAVRFAVQDAALPICSEQSLRPWYPNAVNRLDVHQAYNGDDVWLGPYQGADLHGGLDVNMPIGTPLWAPLSFDDQFYFNSLAQGDNNNRWRGIRNWSSGARWVLQAHHMTRLLVPERTPLAQGEHYAEAAGVLTGSHAHSHFVFKVGDEGSEIGLDPWIVFWQIFENNKRAAGEIRAAIAPLHPATAGQAVAFRSEGSRAGRTGNGLSYTWTFGDGGCSRDENPTYAFARPGLYAVTLVVDDGTELATTTQHVTVDGPPSSSPVMVLAAPDEMEFAPRPLAAMDVYGAPVRFVPHTLRFVARPASNPRPAAKSVLVRSVGGQPLPPPAFRVEYLQSRGWLRVESEAVEDEMRMAVSVDASKLSAKHGIYRAVVHVDSPQSLNPSQPFMVQLTVPRFAASRGAVVDDLDDACQPSPWCWVAPRFHGPWPAGVEDHYLVGAGPAGLEGTVRYRPDLASGRYEVRLDERTPFRPTKQTPDDPRYTVRVRHRQGVDDLWMEPLRSPVIGEFEFEEGTGGYVEIVSQEATGLVVADAIVFQRLD